MATPTESDTPDSTQYKQMMHAHRAAWNTLDTAIETRSVATLEESLIQFRHVRGLGPDDSRSFSVYFSAGRTLALENVWRHSIGDRSVGAIDLEDAVGDAQRRVGRMLGEYSLRPVNGVEPLHQKGLVSTILFAVAQRGIGLCLANSPRRRGLDVFGIEMPDNSYVEVHGRLDDGEFARRTLHVIVGRLFSDVLRRLPARLKMEFIEGLEGWSRCVEHARQSLAQEARGARIDYLSGLLLEQATISFFELVRRYRPFDKARSPLNPRS